MTVFGRFFVRKWASETIDANPNLTINQYYDTILVLTLKQELKW
jgi:hypothetical protein